MSPAKNAARPLADPEDKRSKPPGGAAAASPRRPRAARVVSRTEAGAPTSIEQIQRRLVGIRAGKSLALAVEEGLPVRAIESLRDALHLEKAKTLRLLRISPSTLSRRENSRSKRLEADESDRVVRFGRLLALAIALMEGDADAARRWLNAPDEALEGHSPLDYSRTEAGFREVERLIHRIEHGVYS